MFNADAIKNVRLTKGGFPARYGGRLSVLEIDMKEGNLKNVEGEGSIGIVASKLTLQGPVVKDKKQLLLFQEEELILTYWPNPSLKMLPMARVLEGIIFTI